MPIRKPLFAALLLLLVPSFSLQANETDIVKYRQSMMKAMGAYVGAISAIVKGNVPYKGQLASHAAALHTIGSSLPELFPAGTGPDKVRTEAKREVWSKQAEFRSKAAAMAQEAEKLEKLAGANDGAALAAQLDAVRKACASCHDAFRIEDH